MRLSTLAFLFAALLVCVSGSSAQPALKTTQELIAAIEKGEGEVAADPWNDNAYKNFRLALIDLQNARKAGRTDLPDIETFVVRVVEKNPNNICAKFNVRTFKQWKGLEKYVEHFELALRFHVDARGDNCAAIAAKDVGILLMKDGQYKRAEEFFAKQKKLAPKDPFVNGYIREAKEKAHTKLMQDLVRLGAAEGSKESRRIEFTTGDIYFGQVNAAGKPHGKGRMQQATGHVYEGSFFDGYKAGIGVYKFANGRVYEGEMYKDVMHGKGRFHMVDWLYTGDFQLGKLTGKGKLVYLTGTDKGSEYEGDFVDGKPHGEGQLRDKDGQIQWGTFENGRMVKQTKW